MLKALRYLCALLLLVHVPIFCKDVLVEFKGAYFLPTDSCVRNIYGNGAALFGPEVTFRLSECRNWYGFTSVDFLIKKGSSVGLCNSTKMYMVPLAFGVKYFIPFCYGDFYAGLGFQPLHLTTINCTQFVVQNTSNWGFGGIAKIGTYINLPHNLLLDFFIDYSFVKIHPGNCCTGPVIPLKANLSGAIFGVGLGYRF